MNKKITEQIEEAADEPEPIATGKPARRNLLSTGSTLLNLALSDNPHGGFVKGKYFLLVGDSSSGKTFLSMTCFAEAMANPVFKHYRLIYDNVEDGCLMDVEGLFGKKVKQALEFPDEDENGVPVFSETVEEFYYHVDDAVKEGEPFIYILDSMDGLSSEYEEDKFEAHKRVARGEGKKGDEAGSYGDGKAKKNSEGLRRILAGIRETDSILIILSQTRDNLGFGFKNKTRSGGRALKFYATAEIWTSIVSEIKKTVKGKPRKIGVKVNAKIEKNRITGKLNEVKMDIYPAYGFDDIGNCIDYLVDEKWWKQKKNSIEATEFEVTATKAKLISEIEKNGWEKKLRTIVGKCWKSIESATRPNRKKRYD